jgi:hypothetical protein
VRDFTIHTSGSDTRLLRFSREGFAPVTVSATDLLARKRWALPPAVAGGELAVISHRSDVQPQSYDLSGVGIRAAGQPGGMVTWVGLSSGKYTITPVYQGGIRGEPVTAQVTASASNILILPRENVGGLNIAVEPAACLEATGMVIASADGAGDREMGFANSVECSLTIGGLKPGAYVLMLNGRDGVLSSVEFVVVPQVETRVNLSAPSVVVSGQVLLNNDPFGDGAIRFASVASPTIVKTVKTNAAGQYLVTLDRAGAYVVGLADDQGQAIAGQQRTSTFESGYNEFTWRIAGGTLRIYVRGVRYVAPVSLTVHAQKHGEVLPGLNLSGMSRSFGSDTPQPFVLRGIGFGSYSVRARQRAGGPAGDGPASVSQQASVTLSEARREVTLTLELGENAAVLRIRDEAGHFIDRVEIIGGTRHVRQQSIGTFLLSGVAGGSRLILRAPGFVPTCRSAPSEGESDVVLQRGRVAEVLLQGVTPFNVPAGWVQWPGADCPVPLQYFDFSAMKTNPGRFRIANFPGSSQISGGIVPGVNTLSIDGAGTIVMQKTK